MRIWIRARLALPCGGCPAAIPFRAVMLEIQIGQTKRARCAACAKRMFDEDPPADLEDDVLAVPQPSLPMEIRRHPDFVTTRALAQHNRYVDYRRRASGERGVMPDIADVLALMTALGTRVGRRTRAHTGP